METKDFPEFVARLTSDFTRILDAGFSEEDYVVIDLSSENSALTSVDISSSKAFTKYIEGYLAGAKKKVAFGGYRERRRLYERSGLFRGDEDESNHRNIHMGIDLWADAHTPVLAALDGLVHSFRDNDNYGDYGPTIILEHEAEGRTFYTLYGHLSRKSMDNLEVGQKVKKAEKIAILGAPEENGDYAPHLHFQIIQDLKEKTGDFPGVVSKNELEFYLNNCPDPNLLLKIGRN